MALGHDGRLVVCEQIGGAIAAVNRSTGERELLVDGFNSPNDVVVKSNGTIWFTGPSSAGVPLQGGVPIKSCGVVIGAIGVSGATDADEDRELAELSVRSLQAAIAARVDGGSRYTRRLDEEP
jgi:Haem-degrading